MGPSGGAVPGVVPAEGVIARTDDIAIALGCLLVYPAGFEFDVSADLKDERSELGHLQFDRDPHGESDRLRLGFEFADGTRVTNMGEDWGGRLDSTSSSLCEKRSSRSGGHSRYSFWLSPLPPPGALEIVCEWPAAGVPLTRYELDAAAIIAAASRAQTIFGDDARARE
jgi:hypothetical protein